MVLPVLALRGLVVFPGMMLQFDVGRKKSILALSKAMDENQMIFLVAQKDLGDNEPKLQGLYRIGVVAKIKQVVRHPEDGVRVFVEACTVRNWPAYRKAIHSWWERFCRCGPVPIAEPSAAKP